MEIETITAITSGIAWPISIMVIVVILRDTITKMISRLKGVEGPTGWKLLFEMRRVGERLEKLESATTDIYNLTGEPLMVREEIFEYIAKMLNEVSESTATEMRMKLNRYHIDHLPEKIKVSEIKNMLKRLYFYEPSDVENDTLNEEISSGFVSAVFKFQNKYRMNDADGIVGPKTIKLLLEKAGKNA